MHVIFSPYKLFWTNQIARFFKLKYIKNYLTYSRFSIFLRGTGLTRLGMSNFDLNQSDCKILETPNAEEKFEPLCYRKTAKKERTLLPPLMGFNQSYCRIL